MEVFSEALRHLDGLKNLASRYVAKQELSRDAPVCDGALDDVINLRRTVIEATRRTEVDRGQLDIAANREGAATASLASLHGRIRTVNERIENAEKFVEDQGRRALLEEANERLTKAKKRVAEKQELMEKREKKLKEFQKELSPVLKLGTITRVSEFDDVARVDEAFFKLPIQLQFLYSQLRTAKKIFDLPIEIGIVPRPQLPKLVESGSEEVDSVMVDSTATASKKQRLSDRKVKHGSEEKRRKRWYETMIGKEAGLFEDLMGTQRTVSTFMLHRNNPPHLEQHSESCQKYELLLELSEGVKKQSVVKRQTKKRRHQSSSKISAEPSPRFPLPVPKVIAFKKQTVWQNVAMQGELSVEVKFFNGEKDVATLVFSWIKGQAFVASMPDWLLARTAIPHDHAISWEQKMKKAFPRQHKAMLATYGYPLRWAQEFCGAGILRRGEMMDESLSPEDVQQMNRKMLQQQEEMAVLVLRLQSHAIDLSAFRSGVKCLKEGTHHGIREGNKDTELVQFRRMDPEKFATRKDDEASSDRSYCGLAAGTWAVAMRKEVTENGTNSSLRNKTSVAMEIDGDLISREAVKVRFYPQLTTEGSKNLGISKSDIYYETGSSCSDSQFRMIPSEKLSEASAGIAGFPKALIGPLPPEEMETKSEWVYGQLIVQKSNRMPKRYLGILPADYERRFFPFELLSKGHIKSVDPKVTESQKELFRIYRVIVQKGHIRLTALLRIDLLKPLSSTVFIESVLASANFKKRILMPTKESKGKASLEGKNRADHIKTERERILKKDVEAMKFRDALENAAARLQTLDQETLLHEKTNKLPTFSCEDARIWISRKMSHCQSLLPEETVEKLERLLTEWCLTNARGVKALTSFLETGLTSKPRRKESSSKSNRAAKGMKDSRKERPSRNRTAEMRHSAAHDEELEQGEIPSVPRAKHATRHRSESRRESSHRGRLRSRTPTRLSAVSTFDFRGRHLNRTPVRFGTMRMDTETPRDRVKGPMSNNRIRR